MSGAPSYVAAFEELRPAILARLITVRASLDHALAGTAPDEARALFDAVLHGFSTLFATGDPTLHHGFVQSFIAVRSALGYGPDHAQRLLVAITDVAGQVARNQLPNDPTIGLAIISAARLSARLVNDIIAGELSQRFEQLPSGSAGGRG